MTRSPPPQPNMVVYLTYQKLTFSFIYYNLFFFRTFKLGKFVSVENLNKLTNFINTFAPECLYLEKKINDSFRLEN